MTTTEFGGTPPPPPPPTTGGPAPHRLLRRSRDDRIAAGVAGGLGEYFGVDPVLFRVLIATSAFFAGAGVLAYLIAWAAIPEQGTLNAPIDRFIGGLRRRRVPVWLVAIAAGVFLWLVAFSWWAPGHFFPVIALVIVLVIVFGRRGRSRNVAPPPPPGAFPDPATAPTVALGADSTPVADPARPAWVGETRQWMSEAREASRERRRRSWPVRVATIITLVVTVAALAAVDAATGIAIPAYFWAIFGISLGGLLVGLVLRRTPWSLLVLLIPSIAGLVAFAPTSASLHDGSGSRDWTPASASDIKSQYHLAFGQGELDLTHVAPLSAPQTVDIRLAAGQVKVLVPPTLNVTVHANLHLGEVTVDGDDCGNSSCGWGVSRTVLPPAGATGAPLTVNVDVADGNVTVNHTS
jgi:phage shock protein PspC (stress-responsive transcriptional regulator)